MSSMYIFTGRIGFKCHDHIYLPAQLVNLVMERSGPSAFTGTIGKQGATKLLMKQSASFPHVVSEGTQIFHHCVK